MKTIPISGRVAQPITRTPTPEGGPSKLRLGGGILAYDAVAQARKSPPARG
jgi:hypothetical protein